MLSVQSDRCPWCESSLQSFLFSLYIFFSMGNEIILTQECSYVCLFHFNHLIGIKFLRMGDKFEGLITQNVIFNDFYFLFLFSPIIYLNM